MTLYEQIYSEVRAHKDEIIVTRCGHWFFIDLDHDLETEEVSVRINYCYEFKGTRLSNLFYAVYQLEQIDAIVRDIFKHVMYRTNCDIRAYKSVKKHDLEFKILMKEIVKVCDISRNCILGWKKA